MTSDLVQEPYAIGGADAASIVRSVERGVASGALRPDDPLPSVRALARQLGLSPTTVATAYRDLRTRGVVVSHDRARTVVANRPPLQARLTQALPPGTIDLTDGSPDPALLPPLSPAWRSIDPQQRLYREAAALPDLVDLVRDSFAADAIPAEHLAIVGGALDGIERVLQVHLAVGDRIAMEDPGYAASLDLVRTLGLPPIPVAIDDQGMHPDALAAALERGARAVLLVPRAQNPTGAALSEERATQLRSVLDDHPDVLVIEDDHAGPVAGADHRTIITRDRSRWAVVRSVAKALGPDLRVAALSGDEHTVSRVVGRQRIGPGWVSRLLQDLTVAVWTRAKHDGTIGSARAAYTERRSSLVDALSVRGVPSSGTSGLNVWVPVPEEAAVVQGMLVRGWGVQAGQPYRLAAPPGVRITVARLTLDHVAACADALAATLNDRDTNRQA